MQNCSTCGYQSPEGAKFCRQCGAPLYAESELSGADTRNYGRQEAAPVFSAPLPRVAPSVVDAFGSETARYNKPPAPAAAPGLGTSNLPPAGPMFVQAPPAYHPVVHNTAPIKSKRRFLKWGLYGLLLLMAGGIGAGINEESNSGREYLSPVDRMRLEAMRKEDEINRALVSSVTERRERLRDELERRLDDIQRAKDDAQRAIERNSPGLDENPLDLKAFEYPGATSVQYSHIIGKELMTLRTKDDFETIRDYYQKKLGNPYLETNERNQRRALFQTAGTPSATILVQESNNRNQEKIIGVRTPFRFPKLLNNTAQPAPAAEPAPVNKPAVSEVPVAPEKPAPAQAPKKQN